MLPAILHERYFKRALIPFLESSGGPPSFAVGGRIAAEVPLARGRNISAS